MDLQKEREAFLKWHYQAYLLENPEINMQNVLIVKKQFSDGVKRSVIPFERHEIKEFYELDEYLSQRYELFLKQYFNNGKGFIQDLHLAMASKYRKAVMMNNLAKVA